MARVEKLLFETDENTPADDARLQELELLSILVEEYEKKTIQYRQRQILPSNR